MLTVVWLLCVPGGGGGCAVCLKQKSGIKVLSCVENWNSLSQRKFPDCFYSRKLFPTSPSETFPKAFHFDFFLPFQLSSTALFKCLQRKTLTMKWQIHLERWALHRSQNCSLLPPQSSPVKSTSWAAHLGLGGTLDSCGTGPLNHLPGASMKRRPLPVCSSPSHSPSFLSQFAFAVQQFPVSKAAPVSLCSEGWRESRNCVINQWLSLRVNCKMLVKVRFRWTPLRPLHTHIHTRPYPGLITEISVWHQTSRQRASLHCAERSPGPEGRVVTHTAPQPNTLLGQAARKPRAV